MSNSRFMSVLPTRTLQILIFRASTAVDILPFAIFGLQDFGL